MADKYKFYEFFAGGGMVRAGIGKKWECLFANDLDILKASTYKENWGGDHFDARDICVLTASDISNEADMAWASFPCQDLSVAGNGHGIGSADALKLTRSGTLWPFLKLIKQLKLAHRDPSIIVLENVVGLLTRDDGRHFSKICSMLATLEYKYGAVIIDARYFVPQSRPRVFLVAIHRDVQIPTGLNLPMAKEPWHPPSIVKAYNALPRRTRSDWIWWDLGEAPTLSESALTDIIEDQGADWNSKASTKRFIDMMAPPHLARLREAKAAKRLQIGSLYHRMRREGTQNTQRAEIAFGPTLGCLRTPRGGASCPRIIVVKEKEVRTRLLTIGEAAKLMGLPGNYILPTQYYRAFKVIGDGVVVPVVRHISDKLLEPLAFAARVTRYSKSKRVA